MLFSMYQPEPPELRNPMRQQRIGWTGMDVLVVVTLIILVALGLAMFGLAVDWPPIEELWRRR